MILQESCLAKTRINYIFTLYSHRKVILNCNNISQHYCFYLWSNKCSFLGEHNWPQTWIESRTCNPKVVGSSLRSGSDCRWGEWITSTLSTLNTTTEMRPLSKAPNPQLLPGRHWLPTAPGVCALGWVKCRAQIPSMGHHTWPHTTSL